jgi:glycerophosphoryl diester phosphodiesterase
MHRSPLGPPSVGTGPLIYAHRGDRSRAADNTLEAFALAVEAGADGIECDVRRTADGVLIMSHDPTHGDLPPLCDMAFADLRDAAPEVPTLAETLESIPSRVYLNVEIKNVPNQPDFDPTRSIVSEVLDLIASADEPGRIVLSSFDPDSVRAAEGYAKLARGLLIAGGVSMDKAIEMARDLGVEALHPPMTSIASDPSTIVDSIHVAGLAVVVWNANTAAEIEAATEAGVDVIITDDPGLGRSIV